jgi:hypothetical protein
MFSETKNVIISAHGSALAIAQSEVIFRTSISVGSPQPWCWTYRMAEMGARLDSAFVHLIVSSSM